MFISFFFHSDTPFWCQPENRACFSCSTALFLSDRQIPGCTRILRFIWHTCSLFTVRNSRNLLRFGHRVQAETLFLTIRSLTSRSITGNLHKKSCGKIPQQKNILKKQPKAQNPACISVLPRHTCACPCSYRHAKMQKSGTTNNGAVQSLSALILFRFSNAFFRRQKSTWQYPFPLPFGPVPKHAPFKIFSRYRYYRKDPWPCRRIWPVYVFYYTNHNIFCQLFSEFSTPADSSSKIPAKIPPFTNPPGQACQFRKQFALHAQLIIGEARKKAFLFLF